MSRSDENVAVVVRQLLDACADGRPRLLSLEQLICRCTPVRELLDVMAILLKGGQQDVNGFFRFPASRPQLHERGVDDNPVQPGRKQAGSLEFVQPRNALRYADCTTSRASSSFRVNRRATASRRPPNTRIIVSKAHSCPARRAARRAFSSTTSPRIE